MGRLFGLRAMVWWGCALICLALPGPAWGGGPIGVDGAGNVVIIGLTGPSRDKISIYKYLPGGGLAWTKTYGSGLVAEPAPVLAVDPNGNVYVGVTKYNTSSRTGKSLIVKYNADGVFAWARTPSKGGSNNFITNLTVDSDGNIIAAGASFYSGEMSYYLTTKYNPGGSEVWSKLADFSAAAGRNSYATAVTTDAAKGVYVTGTSRTVTEDYSSYLTVKYTSGGTMAWHKFYGGPINSARGVDLAVTALGNVWVTGNSKNSRHTYDITTNKYNASNGALLKQLVYNGPADTNDTASALVVDSAGQVYITGISNNGIMNVDFITIKLTADGWLDWMKSYDSTYHANDEPAALAVDGSGNVIVTGMSKNTSNYDFLTVKYAATGARAWAKRYNGPGNGQDWATGVAVDASGNIFVTGISQGPTATYDLFTRKYYPDGSVHWSKRIPVP